MGGRAQVCTGCSKARRLARHERFRQPLHVLGKHRRFPAGLLFAVNLIPDLAAGETTLIRVGDAVKLL